MLQIRTHVFETNSSSTHSLTLFTPEEWQSFKTDPDLLINKDGCFISKEAAIAKYKRMFHVEDDAFDEEIFRWEGDYFTYQDVDAGYDGAKCLELPDGSAVVSVYVFE